jgi:DNA repair protein RecO (recombination protein O)
MSRRGKEIDFEAVVLRAKTTGENDLLVDLLTPDLGRVHAIARHGRKSQKRFGTVLESFNRVRARGHDAGGLVSLNEATLSHPWRRLDSDLRLLTAGFHVVELIRRLVPERSPDARVFELVVECLETLDRSSAAEVAAALARFEYRLLDVSGLGPNLKECLSCRRVRPKEDRGSFFFVYREGGLFCADCLPPGLDFDPFRREEAPRLLSRFIEYQLGRPLKTVKFLTDKDFCG